MNPIEASVWPNDVVVSPHELDRESPHRLVCFLLSPFEPKEVFDPVHEAVRATCKLCAQTAGIDIECRRADTLYEAKTIHDDIWRHICAADLIVIDITTLNPNVMIELGVAAAVRRPTQVILIKAADDPHPIPFNTFAQRCLKYHRSIVGDQAFLLGLTDAMVQAITPAPYVPVLPVEPALTVFKVDFAVGDRPDMIRGPGITHRRLVDDHLDYGSLYVFRNSWLLLGSQDFRNVRVQLRLRFGSVAREGAWIGVSLRNQHFFANWGHLVYLRADGHVMRTEPREDGSHRDVEVSPMSAFDHRACDWIDFTVSFTDDLMEFKVGTVEAQVRVSEMPYVFGAGKVRLQTSLCRVQIRDIELTPL